MSVDQLLIWVLAGGGVGGTIVTLLRVGLPWARKLVPAVVSVGGALEESRTRLVASLQTEATEYLRQLTAERAKNAVLAAALEECEGKLHGDGA